MIKKALFIAALLLLFSQVGRAYATVCLPSTLTNFTITVDSAFCAVASPYTLNGFLYVPPDLTLYVEQGVTVRGDNVAQIVVDGSFQAIGTAAEPILFTSNRAPQQPGDWYGIDLKADSLDNELVFVTVEYAGYGGYPAVRISSDDVSFRNSMIRSNLQSGIGIIHASPFLWQLDIENNGAEAVLLQNGGAPDWFHLAASGNGYDGVRLHSLHTSDNLTLGDNGISDYRLTSDLTVNSGTTLTIAPGTSLIFKTGTCGTGTINVGGTLSAIGTSSRRINMDGGEVGCRASGEWRRIHFDSGSSGNVLEYVNIFDGGGSTSPMVYVETSDVTIRYASLSGSAREAVYVDGAASPTIEHSNIFNNAGGGVVHESAGRTRAECIYWGDPSGANSADNATGTGQSVTGNVDTVPFRTQFFLLEDTNCIVVPTAITLAGSAMTAPVHSGLLTLAFAILFPVTLTLLNRPTKEAGA